MIAGKEVETNHPLIDVIKKRWSPRAFSPKPVADADMQTLFEAARWSASASNEQPWKYIYAHRGTEGFRKIWECLKPGNQPWAKNAAVLVIAMIRKTNEKSGAENMWAEHDLGMANSNLLHQAVSMGIYCHPMAGFEKGKTIETFGLDDDIAPVCFIAIGYRDEPETLEEPFMSRELTARTRKPTTEFIQNVG